MLQVLCDSICCKSSAIICVVRPLRSVTIISYCDQHLCPFFSSTCRSVTFWLTYPFPLPLSRSTILYFNTCLVNYLPLNGALIMHLILSVRWKAKVKLLIGGPICTVKSLIWTKESLCTASIDYALIKKKTSVFFSGYFCV